MFAYDIVMSTFLWDGVFVLLSLFEGLHIIPLVSKVSKMG